MPNFAILNDAPAAMLVFFTPSGDQFWKEAATSNFLSDNDMAAGDVNADHAGVFTDAAPANPSPAETGSWETPAKEKPFFHSCAESIPENITPVTAAIIYAFVFILSLDYLFVMLLAVI